jgi:hypothetical protein
MDPVLKAMVKDEAEIRIKADQYPQVVIETDDGPKPYNLRPLSELYAKDRGEVNIKDDEYLPLLYCIESVIVAKYKDNRTMTDSRALLTIKQLGMDPERPGDSLAEAINMSLRMCLSFHDYSRQEVRQALRQVAKSIERHTAIDGVRGYLDFIEEFIEHGNY